MQRLGIAAFLIVAIVLAFVLTKEPDDSLPTDPNAILQPKEEEKAKLEPAKAVVKETEFNFGTVSQGESGTHTFEIENAGPGVLHLKKGEPTCKCTSFEVIPLQVPPGEKAKVEVAWKNEEASPEFVVEAPVFALNDADQPMIQFMISGVIKETYGYSPTEGLTFGSVNIGQSVTRTVTFRDDRNVGYKVLKTEMQPNQLDPSLFKIEVKESFEEGLIEESPLEKPKAGDTKDEEPPKLRRINVDVTFTPSGTHIGDFTEGLNIETDVKIKKFAKLLVLLRGYINGPLEVQPRRVVFPLIRRGSAKTVQVVVYYTQQATKPTLEVPESLQFLDAKVTIDPKDKNRYVIDLTVPGDVKPGRYKDDLTIRTGVEQFPTIILPFQAVVINQG